MERVRSKLIRIKLISCFESDKEFFVNIEQVIENYLNTGVMRKKCASNTEGRQELNEGFEILRIDRQTDRQTGRNVVTNSEYVNSSLLFLSHTLLFIYFNYSWTITVSQQQETVHGLQQN